LRADIIIDEPFDSPFGARSGLFDLRLVSLAVDQIKQNRLAAVRSKKEKEQGSPCGKTGSLYSRDSERASEFYKKSAFSLIPYAQRYTGNVSIPKRSSGIHIAEHRLLQRMGTFGEHMKDYGKDIGSYVTAGFKEKDPIKAVTGAVMAPLSVLLEGPDQTYDAFLGREYQRPEGIAGRTRRDVKLLLKDIVTLHPLLALGDAWRLGTSDWILDAGDALGGHTKRMAA
jgi:hypothetical protein